jgi:hypothetical protein
MPIETRATVKNTTVKGVAAEAHATALPPTIVIEAWKDLYERRRSLLIVAALATAASFAITHFVHNGWISWPVGGGLAAVAFLLRVWAFQKKRVRTVDRHS